MAIEWEHNDMLAKEPATVLEDSDCSRRTGDEAGGAVA